jgi:hypothetical protein
VTSGQLASQLRDIAVMARNDGCADALCRELGIVANKVVWGYTYAARKDLRHIQACVGTDYFLTRGAEVHVQLAIEAFESVHGSIDMEQS